MVNTGPESIEPSAASGDGGAGLRQAGAGAGQGRELADSPGADVRRGVPALAERGDLHDVPGMRRVDELPAADVDADVAEPVEEDEITRLELIARHGCSVAVLGAGVVRQGDPYLAEDVGHEARAVEPARRRAAPDVRRAEVPHRHADHAAVLRRRNDGRALRGRRRRPDDRVVDRLRLEALLGLPRQGELAGVLLCLQLRDLSLDLGEQPPALAELRLDVRLLRPALRDQPLLLDTRLPELCALALDELLERAHLADHLRVLRRDPVRRVEAVQDLVQTLGAEDDVQRGVVAVPRVERDEPCRERQLSVLQVGLGDLQLVPVLLLLELDLAEAPVGAVEGLDRALQLAVDRVDLSEDLLCLRLLRCDGAGIGGRCASDQESRCKRNDDAARLSFPRTNTSLQVSVAGLRAGGAGSSQGREASRGSGHPQPTSVRNSAAITKKSGYAAEICHTRLW